MMSMRCIAFSIFDGMTGIYLHIPFCAQACHYCNFHFSTTLSLKETMVAAVKKEIAMRADRESIHTVYFGGGTPSVLPVEEVQSLMKCLADHFDLSKVQEVTFEVNPEDVTPDYISGLRDAGITRLSVGIQSFFDQDLKPMNRIHLASEALQALEIIMNQNFPSITADLIYGIPWAEEDHFEKNLNRLIEFGIPHISAYALTVEPKTALSYHIKKGISPPVDDEQAFREFLFLQNWAESNNFEHYEISNLCLPGKESIHNSNYWEGASYFGFGPGAHSYNGEKRSWNVSHNKKYIDSLNSDQLPFQEEKLRQVDRYNEWVMTGLRRSVGIEKSKAKIYSQEIQVVFLKEITKKIEQGILLEKQGRLSLSKNQRFFADGHASDIFFI